MSLRRSLLPLLAIVCAAPQLLAQSAPSNASTAPYLKEFGTMWTFDAPPLDYWKRTYNFTPDQGWLDHVRLSAVRLSTGCSASFVSSNGLVMTNHHCGRECTAAVSPKDTNYIASGFAAANVADEKRCTGFYVDQLQSISPVTDQVRAAVTGKTPTEQQRQRDAVIKQIEQACQTQTGLTCQVITLYHGGIYSLYRYKRYSDVRLVMAPEENISFYGGDPDNFTYPRYDLDLTLLRIYENGQPLHPKDYLKWSQHGAAENELVFVTGNPGSTGRLLTVSQLQYLRDVTFPIRLAELDRQLNVLYMRVQKDGLRPYQNNIFIAKNSRKAIAGFERGLLDSTLMARKVSFEHDFRARIDANPALKAKYGSAWDAITAAKQEQRSFAKQLEYDNLATVSPLYTMAVQLVRIPLEAMKPDSLRRAAYRTGAVEQMKASIPTDPIDTGTERLVLTTRLAAAMRALPSTDLFIKTALHGRTPEQAVNEMLAATRLTDTAYRRSLLNGGMAAINASTDPFIVLARTMDQTNRNLADHADHLNAAIASNAGKIGEAIFAAYGTNLPPDATFSLRITDGVVKGYPMNGTVAPYKTSFYGLFARAAEFDNQEPFALPPRWIAKRDKLDLSTPFDFVSTTDIVGGNSGSPVINKNAEVVGLIFDSNIEGLSNNFIFTDDVARSVSVSSRAITEALRKVYDATRIADELEGR
ncbi:MAG TPA: S46 family peptidase [Gemmatimonadaceae bacterium]|jgi:hypothetical protein|nr:S46 family peptidase [Gemmatimonadaceae bacterium]